MERQDSVVSVVALCRGCMKSFISIPSSCRFSSHGSIAHSPCMETKLDEAMVRLAPSRTQLRSAKLKPCARINTAKLIDHTRRIWYKANDII